ncbi:Myb-like_DNA-binding domain-containing protein [Hexamita inflata]|uniref:Myb-like DNA-binding domain-containing protein n=1 Tax=Hexamita inflata TaxID=28002 RepID=A0AA86TPM7_9EUKA|nr:Myb-like DNA-binding domain-containing protein [Hexamita inflata]
MTQDQCDVDILFSIFPEEWSQQTNTQLNKHQNEIQSHLAKQLTRKNSQHSYKHQPPTRIRWTTQEHDLFLKALLQHGRREHSRISAEVGSKSISQCTSHSQKFFIQLKNQYNKGQFDYISVFEAEQIKIQFPNAFQNRDLRKTAAGILNVLNKNAEEIVQMFIVTILQHNE